MYSNSIVHGRMHEAYTREDPGSNPRADRDKFELCLLSCCRIPYPRCHVLVWDCTRLSENKTKHKYSDSQTKYSITSSSVLWVAHFAAVSQKCGLHQCWPSIFISNNIHCPSLIQHNFWLVSFQISQVAAATCRCYCFFGAIVLAVLSAGITCKHREAIPVCFSPFINKPAQF